MFENADSSLRFDNISVGWHFHVAKIGCVFGIVFIFPAHFNE